MKPRWEGFRSPIAAAIERYLAHKRALGCRFRTEEKALCLLDRFLVERGVKAIDEIGPELIEAFLASRPRTRPRSYNHLLCTVRRLYDWLVAQGDLPSSPVRTRPRRETSHRIPFLFNADLARRLLEAAARLPDRSHAPLRGQTYRTMFALLYGLGLRVGEVARLHVGDVDLDRQLLVIRDTKFSKSRLVPFGPRIRLTASLMLSPSVDFPSIFQMKSPALMPARCAGVSSMGAMTVSLPSDMVTSRPRPPKEPEISIFISLKKSGGR